MKLVTFQTMEAFKELVSKGYLECNSKYINIEKAGPTYLWVLEQMNELVPNPTKAKYPLWCWVKFKNGICPPKHKGEKIKGFDVKITFHKEEKDILITDYRRYSFLLNNLLIPETKKEQEEFEKELEEKKITKEELKAFVRPDKYPTHRTDKEYLAVCEKIRKTFSRCITKESDCLQGCIWRINLNEVESIEILNDENYSYGSFNYKRKNGTRFDWREDYYKKLK